MAKGTGKATKRPLAKPAPGSKTKGQVFATEEEPQWNEDLDVKEEDDYADGEEEEEEGAEDQSSDESSVYSELEDEEGN